MLNLIIMEKIFGHWIVDNNSITWDNHNHGRYTIESQRLLEETRRGAITVYDWLVHIPAKNWMTREDVLDLNKAFLYLAKLTNQEIDMQKFQRSIEYQR